MSNRYIAEEVSLFEEVRKKFIIKGQVAPLHALKA
jgi:hypothetical protein